MTIKKVISVGVIVAAMSHGSFTRSEPKQTSLSSTSAEQPRGAVLSIRAVPRVGPWAMGRSDPECPLGHNM